METSVGTARSTWESLLKGVRSELDRTQNDERSSIGPSCPTLLIVGFVRLVRHGVAAFPVAVEHGTELGDDIGIASR